MTSINLNITLHPFFDVMENYNIDLDDLDYLQHEIVDDCYKEEFVIEDDNYKGLKYSTREGDGDFHNVYLVIKKDPNFQYYDGRKEEFPIQVQDFINKF